MLRWRQLPHFLDLPPLVLLGTVPASQLPLGTGLFLLRLTHGPVSKEGAWNKEFLLKSCPRNDKGTCYK